MTGIRIVGDEQVAELQLLPTYDAMHARAQEMLMEQMPPTGGTLTVQLY